MHTKHILKKISRKISDLVKTPLLTLSGDKKPFIGENTFIVWEPCSVSHAEVVPGFVKYFLDLGYDVSVVTTPKQIKDGLFEKFSHSKLHINAIPRGAAFDFFENHGIDNAKGIMVTTAGKLSPRRVYEDERNFFCGLKKDQKVLLVEHKLDCALESGNFEESLITLRRMNFKGAKTAVVNPHFFGEIRAHSKNPDIVKFVLVGSLQPHKRNNATVIDAVKKLHAQGIKNFKISVIGKGTLKGVNEELKQFFDIKGTLSFKDMYAEIESADFFLTAYRDPENKRYNTCGTSGCFQLIYGFAKPCIISSDFSEINDFTTQNSIVYAPDSDYSEAMKKAIDMRAEDYADMRKALLETVAKIEADSLEDLKKLLK